MEPADFYTGIVVDAYARLKSTSFDAATYAAFVSAHGEPGLEIGCGDGEPLLSLRAQGLDVEGVDSSLDMLNRCRSNAARAGLEVTLHHARMEDLTLGRVYRSIYLAGPTFNLLADDATALRALTAIRAHLSVDGRVMVPLWIPPPTPPEELNAARKSVDDDGAVLRYTPLSETYDETARTRVTQVRYERQTGSSLEQVDREWVLHWHTQAGFRQLCAEAGLTVDSVQDGDGRPASAAAGYFTCYLRP